MSLIGTFLIKMSILLNLDKKLFMRRVKRPLVRGCRLNNSPPKALSLSLSLLTPDQVTLNSP
jgi:hypothetical protein